MTTTSKFNFRKETLIKFYLKDCFQFYLKGYYSIQMEDNTNRSLRLIKGDKTA